MENITDTSNENISFEQLQQELSQALTQAEENLNGWKRTQADFENYRKRQDQERELLVEVIRAKSYLDILPLLDSLDQAAVQLPEVEDQKFQQWKQGWLALQNQIDSALNKIGLKKISAVGQKFNPEIHEAVREVSGAEDGLVAEQYQAGYMLGDRLLRPAQVAITKSNS